MSVVTKIISDPICRTVQNRSTGLMTTNLPKVGPGFKHGNERKNGLHILASL